jgi:hypothetical protein
MKNTLKIDFVKQQIIMDRTFVQKCTNTSSKEYDQLQRVRQDYPEYTVIQRRIKRNPNKKTYSGLTYEYMEDYIMRNEPEDTKMEVLDKFYDLQMIAACHSRAYRYPVIKKWFLAKYPEIANFGKDVSTVEVEDTPVDTARICPLSNEESAA